MLGNSVLSGIFPVIGSIIAAKVLNALADVITGSIDSFRTILVLLCLQFAYSFAVSLINTVYSMIIRIANELVANEIKIKIISKAREIDLKNFDMPEFYEKMENANREASVRPFYAERHFLYHKRDYFGRQLYRDPRKCKPVCTLTDDSTRGSQRRNKLCLPHEKLPVYAPPKPRQA